jgi:NAD(P)-dependent dehydrogenase (short-subunit alcohol dehydrogenase family)
MTKAHAVYPSLAGRAVFVTGGGSGIGASIVEAFARQKCKVAFVDVDERHPQSSSAPLAGRCPTFEPVT